MSKITPRPAVALTARKGFTPKQRAEVLLAGGGRCSLCGEKIMAGETWEVEHRVALGLGGTNDPSNLEPAHGACHRKKTAGQDVPAIAKAKRLHKKRAWSKTEDNALRERGHEGVEALAVALDRSVLAVNTRASKIGVRLGRCHPESSVWLPDNFEQRVEFDPFGGCWLWPGTTNKGGYGIGSQRVKGRDAPERALAHRMAWEVYRGPIPAGLFVLHRCDVRCCVNPAHLFLGTLADNAQDMVAKGRKALFIGEDAHNAKLTREQADRIIAMRTAGAGPVEIARETGTPRPIVNNVLYRGDWTGKRKIPSRGFAKGPKQKIPSRGFPKRRKDDA